ncbi:unnamed protein product [Alopecurus aequalis]
MAEQIFNSVTLAVTGELTSRVFSGLIQRYGKDATTSEKLQRLEMLLIKIHSAVEASEKRNIQNSWLLQWCDKLKEAASQGDEVLARFLQPAKDAKATSNAGANQKQGSYLGAMAEQIFNSVTLAVTGELTSRVFSGLIQRYGKDATTSEKLQRLEMLLIKIHSAVEASEKRNIQNSWLLQWCDKLKEAASQGDEGIGSATKVHFVSGDDDMERLNKVLARLDKLSPDIRQFIRLLHLEALPKIVRPISCAVSLSAKVHGPTKRVSFGSLPLEEKMKEMSAQCTEEEKSEHFLKSKCVSACLHEEQQGPLLQGRLEEAFSEICKAVKLADCHNLEGLKWLAYWNAIYREAKEQHCAILDAITARKIVTTEDEELVVGDDQEKYELSSFVHRQERLARDVEYFKKLVYLCPAC